ncbi:MAG: glucosaminidase domain-containing protein [Paludibacteraceae bacterium]
MRKIFLFSLLTVASVFVAFGQQQNEKYLAYIVQWSETAVANQHDYGIPASIILAQGLLESAAGTSELAREANNHFGIKCTSDWMGGNYYHDDDAKDDCFRVYGDAAESFKDHALFLQRPRYQTCFEIVVEDYSGWAYRLKQCGYATDPAYPKKLIKLIEDYRLDTIAASFMVSGTPTPKAQPQNKVLSPTAPAVVSNTALDGEYVEPLSAYKEKQLFLLTHAKHTCNGLKYIIAREGDTYANIAFRMNVKERTLREWNDALGRDLAAGDRVFLSRKKCTVPQEKALMWVHPGETLWQVCQREGIQMRKVQKLNGFAPSVQVFKTRQQILLRKQK